MGLIVQKYGGSSVANPTKIKGVAARIMATLRAGNQVVVVVSAMGKDTDKLIQLAREVGLGAYQPESERELDLLLATGEQVTTCLLAICLQSQGQAAIALNARQVQIITEPQHGRARILRIETSRLRQHLDQGQVVVVTGFQGIMPDSDEFTTLGRGGSDTSAVAIAAALKADLCEIYTDVPGILTTDPNLVPEARLLEQITCDEMLELASQGAKVLHPRAVEIARNFGVKMSVRSTWLDDPGTLVVCPEISNGDHRALETSGFVQGVMVDTEQVKVALLGVPDQPGIAAQLFTALAQQQVNVDLIVQSIQNHGDRGDLNDIVFTIPPQDLDLAQAVTQGLDLGAETVVIDSNVAKVSIVGAGIVGRPGIAAQMFTALSQAGVNIQIISTSEVKLSCVISKTESETAIACLTESFGVPLISSPTCSTCTTAVSGIALDRDRARLAIRKVPDLPGTAARIFQHLADQGLSIDMIIQSQSDQNCNDIAFTVALADLAKAKTALGQIAAQLGCGAIEPDGKIAKLSIVGAGMANQSGVAAQMFQALAQLQINIEMIATSEIKVSCVIRESEAVRALQKIHQQFQLG
ncbi:MAG: aspartate kinase [Pseudanabaenaceae cyanobacterium bins.68]|nr:aspartate kinase [Pseudanabaenaceae cyanobacterium bins.68]